MSYITNITKVTAENTNFRTVLFTGDESQLVVMSIPAGGDIGKEKHAHVEQTLVIQAGTATVVLDGKESEVSAGDVIVVTPGVKHNITNTGTTDLKLFTIYAPANHLAGRVHATKAEAEADVADEAFGEQVS